MLRRFALATAAALTLAAFTQAADVKAGKDTLSVSDAEINNAALDKLGWKLSCQFWTFRQYSAFETLDILHAMGIHYAELYPGQKLSPDKPDSHVGPDLSEDDLAALKQKLSDTGVTAVNFGVCDVNKGEDETRKLFEFAKKLGLKTLVAEPDAKSFDLLDKLTDEYRITIAIHDHPKPSHYWNPDTLLKAINGHSPRIGSCADIGHFVRSGLSSLESVQKLKGHIISLHFKDVMPEPGGGGYAGYGDVVWGTGKVDCAGIMKELNSQHFQGVMSIEYEKTTGQELVDNVEKSVKFFSEQATQIADSNQASVDLFNGHDLTGWHNYHQPGKEVTNWKAEDGVLTCATKGHDLITDAKYDSFILDLDYRVGAGVNSGIVYRCDESENAAWQTGVEYQLIDNAEKDPLEKHMNAAAYALYGCLTNATNPAGEWNHARIVVDGSHVEHWLNGVKVVSYDYDSDDFKAKVEESKFKVYKNFAKLPSGQIAFQGDHSANVSFKNIKLQPLAAK